MYASTAVQADIFTGSISVYTVYIPNLTCNKSILRAVDLLFMVKHIGLQRNNPALTLGTLNHFAICLSFSPQCISLIMVIKSVENIQLRYTLCEY